jgi:uncharacterized protein (DUF433 family)
MDSLELTYTVPLVYGEDGTIRIRGSRVTLDSIIHAFQQGATAEQIQDSFSSVTLGDIYGAIAYYLEHRARVDAYLTRQEQAAQEARQMHAQRPEVIAFRERIRLRRRDVGQA